VCFKFLLCRLYNSGAYINRVTFVEILVLNTAVFAILVISNSFVLKEAVLLHSENIKLTRILR